MSHIEKYRSTSLFCKRVFQLLDDPIEISILSDDSDLAHFALDAAGKEILRIDKLLSLSYESSEVNTINAAAGLGWVKVSSETYSIIARSLKISYLLRGRLILVSIPLTKSHLIPPVKPNQQTK